MQVNKYLSLLAPPVLLVAATVKAEPTPDSTSDPATNRPPVVVSSKQEFVTGLPPATRIYVTNGPETYALLTPAGYRLDNSVQDRIQLVNEKYDCFMTFRVVSTEREDKTQSDSAYYRALLSDRYPDIKIFKEFSQEAGGLPGLAFDFQWQGQARTIRASRVVFIPSSTGILEFSLVCSSDKFGRVQNDFHLLLLTFRAGESGRLKTMPRSNSL